MPYILLSIYLLIERIRQTVTLTSTTLLSESYIYYYHSNHTHRTLIIH